MDARWCRKLKDRGQLSRLVRIWFLTFGEIDAGDNIQIIVQVR